MHFIEENNLNACKVSERWFWKTLEVNSIDVLQIA